MSQAVNRPRPLYTVSELTREIKDLLEHEFPLVWVVGEISNLRLPVSGHCYFTLKDPNAQINAVIFKSQANRLKFGLVDGLAVVGLGRLSVYEPRGSYQIIFEHLEPKGVGALQLAFEQLKARLAAEGLFDDERKKKLPFLPSKIHIITSPTGAVVHDMIKIIQRRFPNMPIEVIPARVQGADAEKSLVSALECLARQPDAEVAILARGGGSLEDLQAFNSERLARSISQAAVPIISAVGHETDFTIADFVADLRAPTPSAAAEIAVPEKFRLKERCGELVVRLERQIRTDIAHRRQSVASILARFHSPRRRIQEARLRLDDMEGRLLQVWQYYLDLQKTSVAYLVRRMGQIRLHSAIKIAHAKLDKLDYIMFKLINNTIYSKLAKHRELTGRLEALNPYNVLQRGYSITRALPSRQVVKSSKGVRIQQQVEIQLAAGALLCRVEGKNPHGEENV